MQNNGLVPCLDNEKGRSKDVRPYQMCIKMITTQVFCVVMILRLQCRWVIVVIL
jgi:hypothetical protein